jgi:hypothetical protein
MVQIFGAAPFIWYSPSGNIRFGEKEGKIRVVQKPCVLVDILLVVAQLEVTEHMVALGEVLITLRWRGTLYSNAKLPAKPPIPE